MGTKVQSEMYFPGYHSMRDMNNNNPYNGMWDLYQEDKTLENQNSMYSSLKRPSIDGYVGYEKEQLRQTILKQESVFRHQLQELHRLYKKQRDLMNEGTRKELHNYPMVPTTSKPSLFSSQFPPEDSKETRHVSSFAFVDPSISQMDTLKSYSIRPSFDFEKGKSMSRRRMLDLESPAELYDEGIQQLDKIPDLVDLNEPIQAEESPSSGFLNDLDNNACVQDELSRRDACKNSNSGFCLLPQGFSQNLFAATEAGIHPNDKHLGNERNTKEQSSYNCKTGKKRSHERTYLHGEPGKGRESLPSYVTDQANTEPQRRSTLFGVDICKMTHQPSANASQELNSHFSNPLSNVSRSESTFSLPWRKTPVNSSENMLALQDKSCLISLDSFLVNPNSRCIPSSSAEAPLQTDNFLGFTSYSKQFLDCSTLNISFPSSITSKNSGTEHFVKRDPTEIIKVSERSNLTPADTQKHDNHERELPWLLAKPYSSAEQMNGMGSLYQMSLDSLQNHSPQFFKKTERMMKGPTQVLSKDSSAHMCAQNLESLKIKTECLSVQKNLGFPVVEGTHISNSTSGLFKLSDHESNSDEMKGQRVSENEVNNYIPGVRHHIDLNLALNEEESPLAPSFPEVFMEIAMTEIDLEAPAFIESEEADSQKSNSKLPLDNFTDSQEEFTKVAAETIMNISSLSSPSMEASASDLLLWFADVVSSESVNEGVVKPYDAFDEESISEGMDEFEFMTLKLKDTKEEDYSYKPLIFENNNSEEAPSVTKRPRRGQGKRGRQRKDFQRDIMPSLVSLARREVTEDLQTFEEIFTVIGDPWESSISKKKKKAVRNGRGLKRLVGPPPGLIANAVKPPLSMMQPCREVALEEKSAISGWGKRTRRLPRQRCTNTSSHALALKC